MRVYLHCFIVTLLSHKKIILLAPMNIGPVDTFLKKLKNNSQIWQIEESSNFMIYV